MASQAPTWDDFLREALAVQNYGLELSNNADRRDQIRYWHKELTNRVSERRWNKMTESARAGAYDELEDVRHTLADTPAGTVLLLAPAAPERPHTGYYHAGTYPSNPVPLNMPYDPTQPPADPYPHARLHVRRTSEEIAREEAAAAAWAREHDMRALGRRAALHYGMRRARGARW